MKRARKGSRESKIGREKRRSDRIMHPVKVFYRMGRKKIPISAINISGGGVGIVTKVPFKMNDRIKLFLHLEEDDKPCIISARVAWCGPCFHSGLEFLKIKEKEKFDQFICDKMIYKNLG